MDLNQVDLTNPESVYLVLSGPNVARNLPIIFAKLVEPDANRLFIQNYCGALEQAFARDQRQPGQIGLDSFGKLCVRNGVLETTLKMACSDRPEKECQIGAYQALDCVCHLMSTASLQERRELTVELIERGIVNICLEKAFNQRLCLHRQSGVNTLRSLICDSFLGDGLSPAVTADIILKMAQWTLVGPDFFVTQMRDSQTTWQSQMMLGTTNVPATFAARYVPRYYAMAQETALWAAHGLLCCTPTRSRQYILEMLRLKPEIIDTLFKCAAIKRLPYYPETQVDSVACEILGLLFDFPLDLVPGIAVSLDETNPETKASLESLSVLVSREGWSEYITDTWKRLDDEKWEHSRRLFDRVTHDYGAQCPPNDDSFRRIFEYRGTSRITILRIIANLTYLDTVPDFALISFLHIAYLSVQHKLKLQSQVDPDDLDELYAWLENDVDLFRSPMWTLASGDQVEPAQQVPPVPIMGAITLFRLYIALAKRQLLSNVPRWSSLPAGVTSKTNLSRVKQITSPEIVKKFLPNAIKRVTKRREVGHERLREVDLQFSRFAYSSGAELACAIVAFDESTGGMYQRQAMGARKEAVLCLGNTAEISLRLKQWDLVAKFASAAIDVGGDADPREGLEEATLAKNQRRLALAKKSLAVKR
ncbi:hypothetical protein JAAARDRAFT_27614 [Jaapia argillacea MUCL 33604]|uniref:Uncharacterized protein n=1 Tax=Jaapia argillacea MUCL 33604 TaxID=933084 RepID=A0A067QA80_9AGAM|nr:hypothetical protein JAAARDRAFT_27614 [Jaapia argillacea MUCL 33604]